MAVVVTVAKGYDLGYIWKTQDSAAERTNGGYYINAAQAGEPPGRWWGPGAQALGLTPGQTVQRTPYDAVYGQLDPRTGAKLGPVPAWETTMTSGNNRRAGHAGAPSAKPPCPWASDHRRHQAECAGSPYPGKPGSRPHDWPPGTRRGGFRDLSSHPW